MKAPLLFAWLLSAGAALASGLMVKSAKDAPTKDFEAKIQPDKHLSEGEQVFLKGTLKDVGGHFAFEDTSGATIKLEPEHRRNLGPGAVNLVQIYQATKKGGQIELKSRGWEGLEQWNKSKSVLTVAKYAHLHQAFADLEAASASLVASDGEAVHLSNFNQKIDAVSQYLANEYVAANNGQHKAEIVKTYRNVQASRKAIYGRNDNYHPAVYRRIYEQSSAVVAIGARGRPYEGSGVLIGRNIVLTCAHVLKYASADGKDFDVTFDYQDNQPGRSVPIRRVLYRGQTYPGGQEPMDFALVEIEDLGAALPALPTLFSGRVRLDDAVYIIGHPRGLPKMVHDNAFVLFPFQVTKEEMNKIELAVEADTNSSPDAAREVAEFKESYLAPQEGVRTFHELYSKRWGLQPTIAVDADTEHGNSGSPAYLRSGGQIVGVLFAGEPDLHDRYIPGWNRHEAILPISEIIKQLNQWKPTWAQDYGVTIQ